MKRNIIVIISLAVVLVSCQKNIDAPINSNNLSSTSSSDAQIINPIPVATFSSKILAHAVSNFADVIFSDSVVITENDAYLQVLKFNVEGTNLSFKNYCIYVNGVRSNITGTYENGLMTIVLDRKKPLPMGSNYIELKARIFGSAQAFTLNLQKGNVVITDKNGFIVNINGLPLTSSVQIQK
jgi:hypothetical protein